MPPGNLLFIMSDEHSRRVLGCYGHPMVQTPNLDRLAAAGVRFSDAYCNCPICVPSRASFATGRYVHSIRFWDNATPYDGSVPSWGHSLIAAGRRSVSIGKLHYRSTEDNNGFDEEVMPLHVVGGKGDLFGLIRDTLPVRKAALRLGRDAGPGNSTYQDYDERITEAAIAWLTRVAQRPAGPPWVLFVSFVCPHFPLIARPEFYNLYPESAVPLPAMYENSERPDHPFIAAMRASMVYDQGFDAGKVRRAIAAYFGMVTFLDRNIGRVLAALDASGLAAATRVIYTSDHGDNLGTRGLWGKSTMYEESAGVPLIMAGPEIPAGFVCPEPVSLVDCYPTILAATGVAHPDGRDLPGASLDAVLRGHLPGRAVLAEYHASGSPTAAFMLRKGPFKYVHYVGMRPQLFDLAADPFERRDLAADAGYQGVSKDCERSLRSILDPEAVDREAHRDQRAHIEAEGGRAAIMRRGTFGFSPVPGTEPVFD